MGQSGGRELFDVRPWLHSPALVANSQARRLKSRERFEEHRDITRPLAQRLEQFLPLDAPGPYRAHRGSRSRPRSVVQEGRLSEKISRPQRDLIRSRIDGHDPRKNVEQVRVTIAGSDHAIAVRKVPDLPDLPQNVQQGRRKAVGPVHDFQGYRICIQMESFREGADFGQFVVTDTGGRPVASPVFTASANNRLRKSRANSSCFPRNGRIQK